MNVRLAVVAACVFLALPLTAGAQAPVKLSSALQKRLGVQTAPLQAGTASADLKGFAKGLDPSPLVALLNDLEAAKATARLSQTEADRTKALQALDNTVSRKVADAAALQALLDNRKVRAFQQRLALEWGPAFPRMGNAGLDQLSRDLVSGEVALLRIDSPSGKNLLGLKTLTLDLPGTGKVLATVIGPARTADPLMRSGGLLAKVSGPQAKYLTPDLTLPATLPVQGGGQGVWIPASALLRAEGRVWVYVTRDNETFIRRPLANSVYTPQGVMVRSGFSVGERVVTVGSAALYTAENPVGGADK
ncbi:hypothetical protein PQU94_08730 [Asticcacaulis sp. DXS10W]|uniref:Uncharacterized protein n=1 Tax=Asticcacaulis currens TaxID=2984210 RepID=A0ABT5IDT3_9CAUL|nr:hypothetical protein [Asticcacaulis currens]MDC7694365.1 hypothetical protein [Asticcacaulis currens]